VVLAVIAGFAVARFDALGLIAAIPALVFARSITGSLWAPLCFYLVSGSVFDLILSQPPEHALRQATVAVVVWGFRPREVDLVWRAVWGGADTSSEPGGDRDRAEPIQQ
jgi:hypothetical protein